MKFILFAALQLLSFANSPLSNDILKRLDAGEVIVSTKEVKDRPWPEVEVKLFIKATALESVSIFYALDFQKEYIPNLIESRVVKELGAKEIHTEYEMKMPWPLSNGKYIHASSLEYKKESGYTVKWWMVESNTTDYVQGSANFVAHKKGSIMTYKALVSPKSFFAAFVESRMVKDVRKSMIITKDTIEKLKNERSPLLRNYVNKIDQSLSGKKVYLK